jgi:hypothetical protein
LEKSERLDYSFFEKTLIPKLSSAQVSVTILSDELALSEVEVQEGRQTYP